MVEEALDILTLIDTRHVDDDGHVLDYMYDFAELSAMRAALASENDPKDADGEWEPPLGARRTRPLHGFLPFLGPS